jgi:hypothetical protein
MLHHRRQTVAEVVVVVFAPGRLPSIRPAIEPQEIDTPLRGGLNRREQCGRVEGEDVRFRLDDPVCVKGDLWGGCECQKLSRLERARFRER